MCEKGQCPPGSDVGFCEVDVERQCGSTGYRKRMLLSDCGGHATPYHSHAKLRCEYNETAAGHSTVAAILFDGRGLYGKYEATGVLPTDLDACGGHYGYTPESIVGNNVYPASTTQVYHYHVQEQAPFVAACYGPVASVTVAKALFSSCTPTGNTCTSVNNCRPGDLYSVCTSAGHADYILDCPVFSAAVGEESNQIVPTSDCPYCVGGITCNDTMCTGCGRSTLVVPAPQSSSPTTTSTSGLSSQTVGAIAGGTVAGAVLLTSLAALYCWKTGGCRKKEEAGVAPVVSESAVKGVV